MPASQVVVVYAEGSRHMRWVFIPDDDSQLDAVKLLPGEAKIMLPMEVYLSSHSPADFAQILAKTIGEPIGSGRCVELNEADEVVAVCMADPAIDRPLKGARNRLELSDVAAVGDRKSDAGYARPVRPIIESPLNDYEP